MTFSVKEIFYTLQGEGANAGRPAVFCRFTGCNLWSGREEDRASAICKFCDTDFVGTDGTMGGKYLNADDLANRIESHWPTQDRNRRFVVLTGGEPMLQINDALVSSLHSRGFEIAVETNGTIKAVPGIDWICVSPKADTVIVITQGQELKLVYPQLDAPPEKFADLAFENFYLQPMDGPDRLSNSKAAIEYCQKNPLWNLSTQTHKMLGIR
jgi:7-carboxy-7-deazaguanine synthase (Cx14CxxC type)